MCQSTSERASGKTATDMFNVYAGFEKKKRIEGKERDQWAAPKGRYNLITANPDKKGD